MANPNAYVSFVLLFTFLLSPLVLTHHLPEVVSHPNGGRILWPPLSYDENEYLEFQRTFSPIESSNMKNNDDNGKTNYYRYNDFQVADPPETRIHPLHMKDNGFSYPGTQIPVPPDENDEYVEFQRTLFPIESSDIKNNDKIHYRHNDFQLADPPETGIHHSHMKDNSLQSHKFRRSVVGDVEPTYYEDGTKILKRGNYEDEIGTQKKRNYEDETEILKRKNYENGIGALDKKNYEDEIVLTHPKMMKP